MSDCCMGREDLRFRCPDRRGPSLFARARRMGEGVLCRLGKRFMAGCRAGLDAPRAWTGAWSALAAVAVEGFALSASLSLPVAAPGIAMNSGLLWGGAVLLPVLTAVLAGAALPRTIGHADRRAVLWLVSGLAIMADLATALAPGALVYLAARALLGLGLGSFWSVAAGLGDRLSARGSNRRAQLLLAGMGVAGGLLGALILYVAGGAFAALVPGADQIMADRLAFGAAAVIGGLGLAAQLAWLPHLPDNGRMRRSASIRLQAAE